ncbi:MAG TPA: hypothetical protein VMZ05_05395 [Spirochaetota bacterium]|nr:hypothetical protein [Spirochaetota bacterium]
MHRSSDPHPLEYSVHLVFEECTPLLFMSLPQNLLCRLDIFFHSLLLFTARSAANAGYRIVTTGYVAPISPFQSLFLYRWGPVGHDLSSLV